MQLTFADDSSCSRPSRTGMGPLVAVGGIHLDEAVVTSLRHDLDDACDAAGFPEGEQFKWSPDRGTWMWANLRDQQRLEFFTTVLTVAAEYSVEATVVIEDSWCRPALKTSSNAQVDVTRMFLERVENGLRAASTHGLVVHDRPGGSRADEKRFLRQCLETVSTGTEYVRFERIEFFFTATSEQHRFLQLADVVVGCTLSRVGGERTYAPPVFDRVKPLLRRDFGRVGGVGLKIHPDFKYGNLYHWLLGDDVLIKGMSGWALPIQGRPYFTAEAA